MARRVVESRFRPKGRTWPKMYGSLISCGGSTKSTSIVSLAVTAAERGFWGSIFDLDANLSTTRVCGYSEEDLRGLPTVYDLVIGNATLEEVRLPVRYRVIADEDLQEGEDAFEYIEGLWLIPGSKDMANADTKITEDPDQNDWFLDVMHGYDGDEDIWWLDFPASYGRMVYSVARMMDEDDEIIPSVRADPKDVKMIPDLLAELEKIREKNKGKRRIPGRPTMHHLILTGTPTPSYTEAPARRATELAQQKYGKFLLPFVRYSADAKKMHEDECPIPIILPKSYPAEDYRKIATAMGLTERAS